MVNNSIFLSCSGFAIENYHGIYIPTLYISKQLQASRIYHDPLNGITIHKDETPEESLRLLDQPVKIFESKQRPGYEYTLK